MCHVSHVMCHVLHIMCHLLCAMCYVSLVTCQRRQQPLPSANSLAKHRRMFCDDPKNNFSLTGDFRQSLSPNCQFCRNFFCNLFSCSITFVTGSDKTFIEYIDERNRHTCKRYCNLQTESVQCVDSVSTKIKIIRLLKSQDNHLLCALKIFCVWLFWLYLCPFYHLLSPRDLLSPYSRYLFFFFCAQHFIM